MVYFFFFLSWPFMQFQVQDNMKISEDPVWVPPSPSYES